MADDTENLIELLGPKNVIGQAIEHLMTRDDVSRDVAFETLVRSSSRSHRKVRETAAEMILQRQEE